MNHLMEDTIVAISTPLSEGAIGILRLSGVHCSNVVDKIFRAHKNISLSSFQSHRLYTGHVIQGDKPIDEAMGCLMRSPHSYTCEDVFEIFCHGSPLILKKALSLAIEHGARLAEPGEFTKRAFLNGRMDLTQAEAVIDLIKAKSELERDYAFRQVEGDFSKELLSAREKLFYLMVDAEANIDFPEYVSDGVEPHKYDSTILECKLWIKKLLDSVKVQKFVKEGLKIVFMGEPNVGKSSLLNALAGKELAIVTELPGTTRDAVVLDVDIHGLPVRFIDTAGIRKPENIIEQKGIQATLKQFEEADLILWVFDAASPEIEASYALPYLSNGKEAKIILNKVDLCLKMSDDPFKEIFPKREIFKTSALDGTGISELKTNLDEWVQERSALIECQFLINARHQEILKTVVSYLDSAANALHEKLGEDLIASELRYAIEKLDEILGRAVNEEMIEAIFSRFCIGK